MDLLKEVKREKLKKRIIIITIAVVIIAILAFMIINAARNRENDLINKRIISAAPNSIIIFNNDISRVKLYPNTLKNIKENGKKLQLNYHEANFLLNSNYLQEKNKIDAKVSTTNSYTQINNVVCVETDLSKVKERAIIDKININVDKMNIDTEYVDIYAVNDNNEFIAYRLKEPVINNIITINVVDTNIKKYIIAYVPVNNLVLNYDEINMKKGEEIALQFGLNENATNPQLHATVMDENIIQISNNGTIKALNAGTTQLVIQSYKNSISKTINVVVKEIPSEIIIEKENIEIYEDELYELKIEVLPENLENKDVVLVSSNDNIVKIMQDNKIKGIKNGTAKITITTVETPTITKEITVKVKKKKVVQQPTYTEEEPNYTDNDRVEQNNAHNNNNSNNNNNEVNETNTNNQIEDQNTNTEQSGNIIFW